MTIDTNELRRLAQAATPGPWYVTGKLTRYVEARIDGGLIQEVAACGPTKADGGYGPQQEANARLLAAANPAAISELLDRLEAAEKERDELRRCFNEWIDKTEWVQRGINEGTISPKYIGLHRADVLASLLGAAEKERDALRAKIEQMERQEPVGTLYDDGCFVWRNGRPYESNYAGWKLKLYALPGAKGEEK